MKNILFLKKHVYQLLLGWATSIFLIFATYTLLKMQASSHCLILILLAILATLQGKIQLIFLMEMPAKLKFDWKTVLFLFTVFILLIVILGSVWIMNNLNSHMM